MSQPTHSRLLEAARELSVALGDMGLSPTIIGGVAVSLISEPRYTGDLDALIVFDTANARHLLDTLARHRFTPRFAEMEEFARDARLVTLVHEPTGTVVDISLGCMPFESELEMRATLHSITGLNVRIPTPEDLIIMKAIAHRPKDLADIRTISRVHPNLDLDRIRIWLTDYSELLDNPNLWHEIELVVSEATNS